jgi:hypothetical protein
MHPVKIAALALAVALLAPAAARAQAPPPDERAAAQAMAGAVQRARDDIEAMYDDPGVVPSDDCKPLSTMPERHAGDGFMLFLAGFIRQAAPVITPRMRELRTELANVQTADPALIAGRASWRRWMRGIESVEPAPVGVCAMIRRWRRAGYPRAMIREAERVLEQYSPTRGMLRRTKAAARRMVELGVARNDAEPFDLSS